MTEETFEEPNLTQFSLQNYSSVGHIDQDVPKVKPTTGNYSLTEACTTTLNKLDHANFDRRIEQIMQEKIQIKAQLDQ